MDDLTVAAPPPVYSPTQIPQSARFDVRHLLIVVLLTTIGGAIRFTRLDLPSIWFDEAATFARTCGTYQQMLDALEESGFGPVHYTLYWWMRNGLPCWGRLESTKVPANIRGDFGIKRKPGIAINGMVNGTDFIPTRRLVPDGIVMTPFFMRLTPALCGTLLIPAMYWLARELTGRRIALLTALLATFSAYLLNYSRDAKMYADLWLMVVLHIAALLWWLRTRGGVAWWTWVVCGAAMLGLQLQGCIVIGVEVLIVLTASRANWRFLPACIMALIWLPLIPIAWMFGSIARFKNAAALDALAERGLIGRFMQRRFERFNWPVLAIFVLGLALIGVGPAGYFYHFNRYTQRITERGWPSTGLDWVRYYNVGRTGPDLVKFTASAFLTGWEWPRLNEARRINDQRQVDIRTLRLMKTGFVALVIFLALGALPWPRWMRRKSSGTDLIKGPHPTLSRSTGRGEITTSPSQGAFFTPSPLSSPSSPLAPGPSPLSSPSSPLAPGPSPLSSPASPLAPGPSPLSSPPSPLSSPPWLTTLWLLLWIILPAYAIYCVSMPGYSSPLDWLDLLRSLWRENLWFKITLPAVAIACFLLAAPTWTMRLRGAARFVLVVAGVILACLGVYYGYGWLDRKLLNAGVSAWKNHGSLWMPRYLGVTLPAVLIVTSMLILRLPTKLLRGSAVGLFVIINLGQFTGRLTGSEPPTALMVADVIDARNSDGTIKMYYDVDQPDHSVGPGCGVLFHASARYYYAILTKLPTNPDEIRGFSWQFDKRFPARPSRWMSLANSVAADARRDAKLSRLIVWDSLEARKIDLTDKVLNALGPDWKRQSDELFSLRDHWTWRDLLTARRRVYVRISPPTTAPTTMPTTMPEVH